ncbi:hypothetical protein DCAR_0730257 [Daucus carota subsp. sativus]|uniref:DUF6598 domain-containing protein n=1 Tax=Daucus carota subsp. sativus TaxID=79200 RepID=A0A161ZRV7_DAUCS|nr:hypothetical protein DCAR_0730257 [Daucus carota subsp. sativus]
MKIIRYTYSGLEIAQQTPDSDLQALEQHIQTPKLDPQKGNQHMYARHLQESSDSKPPVTFKNFYRDGVPNLHSKVTPLFEVGSVHIDNNQSNEFSSIEIYGTIVLIDDHGNEFYIFDCKHRNDAKSHVLDPKTPTSLILQNFQPRGVPSKFCLLFQLKRRLCGAAEEDIVIFDDYKYIDCTDEVLYDKPQVHVFDSDKGGSIITVTCTIFQCALLAEVGIVVEKTGKCGSGVDESGVAEITGSIVAVTRGLSDDMVPNVRTLLAVSCEKFNFGNYTPLSSLAVPAYSSVEFRGQLSVNRQDLSSVLTFEPCNEINIFHEKQIGRRPYRIRMIVFWKHGATSLPEGNVLEYYAKASETPFTDQRPTSKILETENVVVRQYFKDLKWDRDDFFPTELLEIFSISVCAYDQGDSAFSLRGKVKCYDCRGCLSIFDSDTGGIFTSTSSDIVKLVPDLGRGFVGSHLGIVTELMDNQGREISFGSATYDFDTIKVWRDKRICSVIRGQNGFAAVHYTIFSDAVLVKLSFEAMYNFQSSVAIGCKVHGSINTWYINFNYSTHYAKKYYRSTLFEKEECDAVNLAGGEKIPLSKSVVAVPVYGLLVVEAIVYAQNGKHREELKFKKTFSPAEDQRVIAESRLGKSFGLFMDVEWVRNIPLI